MALNPNIGWHPPTRTRQPATGPQAQYRWPSEVRILSHSRGLSQQHARPSQIYARKARFLPAEGEPGAGS